MTAVLINNLDGGGAQKSLSRLLAGLERRDLLLIILEDIRVQRIPEDIETIVLCPGVKPSRVLKQAWFLRRLIRMRKINIVQSHLYRANFVNILARFMGTRHIVQVVNSGRAGRLKSEGLKGRTTLLAQRLLYPRADLVICKSMGMAADLESVVPNLRRITVIANSFDIAAMESKIQVPDFQSREDGPFRIVSLGRLIKLKRHDLAIRGTRILVDNGYKINLAIYGEGTLRPELENLASDMGLKDIIQLPGFTDNPMDVLKNADALASLSQTEGFPNVLVEAMIARVPVISTDCVSGPREILAPGTDIECRIKESFDVTPYGILTAVDSVAGFVDAVEWLINNSDRRRDMVRRSGERVKEWDVARISRQYEKYLFQEERT